MLPIRVSDEEGNEAKIIERGLLVSNHAVPAPGAKEFDQLPFVENISINGDGTSIDLRVDGSITPISAFVQAIELGDIYIKTANIVIEDTGNINLGDFGNIAGGLTVGLDPFIENKGVKFEITRRPLRTSFDLIRVGTLNPSLGVDDDAFRIKQQQGSGNTLYNPIWDFTRLAAGNEGVRLSAGTKQRLGFVINDDLTSLVAFNVVFTGYIRLIK